MKDMAQTVFFSNNRFIVLPIKPPRFLPKNAPGRLEASIFLNDIVPHHLMSCLRFLELIFPPFHPGYFPLESPAYQDWLQTINFLSEKLNFSKFTLRIYLQDFQTLSSVSDIRRHLTEKQGLAILQDYYSIVTPFEALTRIRRVFVHAAWPWFWTKMRPMRESRYADGVDSVIAETKKMAFNLEQSLEESVMGYGYDSSLLGKHEERDSEWLAEWNSLMHDG